MAAVLSSKDSSYFASSSLRRTQSRSSFAPAPPTHGFPSTSGIAASYLPPSNFYAASDHSSSPPTLGTESTDVSYTSTPDSVLSISSDYDDSLPIGDASPDDDFSLPLLSQEQFFIHPEERSTRHSVHAVSPTDTDVTVVIADPKTLERVEHAEDDTGVTIKPSRQVDYLSHDWKEEDIWSSWRYIVSRRGEFPNSKRLENASWRTWIKAKNNLKTISPEELNWCVSPKCHLYQHPNPVFRFMLTRLLRLKDCDVTWLYGPLQTGSARHSSTCTESSSRALSKSESLVNLQKKPILKKRSMSEVMLQRSLTSSSLLKQAAAAVQAQESRAMLRPNMARASTDCYLTFPLSVRRPSHGHTSSTAQSTDSSGASSPFPERKHIHFNEQVEQCIVVDVKGDDDDDIDMERYAQDSDSDDGVVMKRIKPKKRGPTTRRRVKKTTPAEGKTIAKLPSTTLKYREEGLDTAELELKHDIDVYINSPRITPSSSQETLRPSKQASVFAFDADDDFDVEVASQVSDTTWSSSALDPGSNWPSPRGSVSGEPAGMRRTSSGMFMPCEDGEPPAGDGIFGRVIDTVNTARDIAHVIWNVGWRK